LLRFKVMQASHFKTTPFQKSLYQKWLDGGFQEN